VKKPPRSLLVVVLAVSLIFFGISSPASAATPKAGAACKKAGQTAIAKGKKFTCVKSGKKSGKKLRWNKGVAVAKFLPTPTSTPTPSPTKVSIREPLVIEVFVASDVDDSVKEIIEQSLNLAADEWGLYWPVEYWVVGIDEQASKDLVNDFCQRRDSRGDQGYDDCSRRQGGSENHGIMSYHAITAEAAATGELRGEMGRNGAADWGVHWYASTLPWGLTDLFPGMNGEGEVETVFHEYWHAVQSSFISTLDWDARHELMGPVWFTEGSAEFMAKFLAEKLRSDGKMPKVLRMDNPHTYESQMSGKLFSIDEKMSGECSGTTLTSIVQYSDRCVGLGYELGAWGIAYLVSKTSDDVLLTDFHPVVEELGFEKAFEQTFGLTLLEFNDEFMDFFMSSTEGEKLAMLPRP
jgi:hypothetical protein